MVMDPRDSHPEKDGYAEREPDLILSFDIHSFARNRDLIEDLKRGDYIRFNATIMSYNVVRYRGWTFTEQNSKEQNQPLTKYHGNDE